MSRIVFVNLPVADLPRSKDFFTGLGFAFDEDFSDDSAACLVVNDQATVMLLHRPFFATFTSKDVADATRVTGAIICVSAESREEVDALADRALAQGGRTNQASQDQGLMYGRSFCDLDGHAWEVVWMDPAAMAG